MKTFEYYQDVKCTVWERRYFTVKARNRREADKLARKCRDKAVCFNPDEKSDDVFYRVMEDETIYDTMDLVPLEENHGSPTIEVYRKDNTFIADNGKKK